MANPADLHVIAVISNPIRYKSRGNLYHMFQRMMKRAGVTFHTVETAFGDRPFEFTQDYDPLDIQLRTYDEIWHKENMINICANKLPNDWKYVAWVDGDVAFSQYHDWAIETIEALQHYQVVQMFNEAIDLGPNNEILKVHKGFVSCWHQNGFRAPVDLNGYYYYHGSKDGINQWHPGFAWAMRREVFEEMGGLGQIGGLLDYPAILGSADRSMCLAMFGLADHSFPPGIHDNYKKPILQWQTRAQKYIKKDVGYVKNTLFHYWHGKKQDRKYTERWQVLVKNQFNPETDITRDNQGLMKLVVENERQRVLRDQIRRYFRERNEDSIDL